MNSGTPPRLGDVLALQGRRGEGRLRRRPERPQAPQARAALSPPRKQPRADLPGRDRWLVYRARNMQAEQLLQIVTELDDAMNNTSVILVFDMGGKRLLFPGDAQIENWQYALQNPANRQLLASVNLYKVGHHGSRNATPKSLWKLFEQPHEQEEQQEAAVGADVDARAQARQRGEQERGPARDPGQRAGARHQSLHHPDADRPEGLFPLIRADALGRAG